MFSPLVMYNPEITQKNVVSFVYNIEGKSVKTKWVENRLQDFRPTSGQQIK